jgi:trimeric autotransporter adhesin
MNSAINQKANEITSTVSNTYATKTALNTVDGKFANYSTTSAMNTAINQKADSITQSVSNTYATKTALNNVDGKFANYSTTSQMNSAINQKSDSILSTVSSTYTTKADFNNLSIGGTNLLSSRNILKNTNLAGNTGSNLSGYTDYHCNKDFIKVEPSTKYYIKINNPDTSLKDCKIEKVVTYNNGTYVSQIGLNNRAGEITIPSNANQIKIVFIITGGANYDIVTKYKIKVEKGNRPTDWSPCPEDVDNAINTVDGKFANYSTTSQMNSAINQKANEITSTVSQTYATKTALNTVDGKFANYSTTSQMNSAINQKANEITSTVSQTYTTKTDFNNLSIGGTNLARNTSASYTSSSISGDSANSTWGEEGHRRWWKHGIKIKANESITFSFDYVIDWSGCSQGATDDCGVGIGGGPHPGEYAYDFFAITPFKRYGGSNTQGHFVFTFKPTNHDGDYYAFRPFDL